MQGNAIDGRHSCRTQRVHLTVLLTFLVVCLASFSTVYGAPQAIKFLPEVLSAWAFFCVLFAGSRRKFDLIAPKYWIVFVVMTLFITAGMVSNGLSAGPVLSALRYYLRAMPLFFLPMVVEFPEEAISQQLRCLMWIGILQLPIATYQRYMIWSEGRYTGDPVVGTLMDSGVLSIFLIGCVLVASGLMLRGRLGKAKFLVLFLLLLIPTTLNETKVTAFYVPLGILTAFVVGARPGRRLRVAAVSTFLICGFGAVFLPVYGYFEQGDPYARQDDLAALVTNQRNMQKYLTSSVKGVGATGRDIRRGDALVVPLQYIMQDPLHTLLGLGIGSVSSAKQGGNFSGPYYSLFRDFLLTSFSYFVLEIGLGGISVLLIIYWLLFRDSLAVARRDSGVVGAIAVGWSGVVVLMCVSLVYAQVHLAESLSYVFWYFSGLIAGRRVALEREAAASAAPAAAAAAPLELHSRPLIRL